MRDTTDPKHWGIAGGQWYKQEAMTRMAREEDRYDAMFGNRKYDLLERRVKAQNKALMAMISAHERQADIINDQKKRIEKLEKQVLRLSKLVDPDYLFGGKYYQE